MSKYKNGIRVYPRAYINTQIHVQNKNRNKQQLKQAVIYHESQEKESL